MDPRILEADAYTGGIAVICIIKKELRYRLGYLPLSLLVFYLCDRVYESYDTLEFSYFLLPLILCGILFRSASEIELIRVSNTRLCNVLLVRYFITYAYLSVPPAIWLLFRGEERAPREALTLVTTLLFVTSISLLLRVLIRSPYGTVLFSLLAHAILTVSFKVFLSQTLKLTNPKAIQRFSPFFANTIANSGVYGNNRLIVLGVTVFLISLSYLLAWRADSFLTE